MGGFFNFSGKYSLLVILLVFPIRKNYSSCLLLKTAYS